jgi:hypothetical protein
LLTLKCGAMPGTLNILPLQGKKPFLVMLNIYKCGGSSAAIARHFG